MESSSRKTAREKPPQWPFWKKIARTADPDSAVRERPPPRPPWKTVARTADPDPLDVEVYGFENAPARPDSYSYNITYDDRAVWKSFNADSKSHAQDVRSPPPTKADELEVPKSKHQSRSSKSPSRPTASAVVAHNKAEESKRAAADSSRPSVNPYGVYKENLASLPTDSIRLIRMPQRDHPLLELKVFSLKYAPKYAALSYSWGDCSAMTKLATEPPLPVSKSLETALKTIVSSTQCEWIWVDAVSINQAHPAEKSHQVQKMRKIYERSEVVYIWLGSHLDHVDMPASAVVHTPYQSLIDISTREDIIRNFLRVLNHQNSPSIWWTRLWTVQEVVSAPRALVCFGPFLVSWDVFVSVTTKFEIEDGLVTETCADLDCHNQRYFGHVRTARERVKQLYDLRKHLRSSPGGEEILDLLRLTSTANSSNPRDKVYGILGLATQRDQAGITVDYRHSVARVFGGTALHIMQSKQSMDVLVDQWNRRCGVVYDRNAEKSLPSWVPDFSRPTRRMEPTARIRKYNASGGKQPNVEMRPRLELVMEAVYFDEIEEAMVNCIDESEPGMELDTFRLITLPSLETMVAPVLQRKTASSDWRSGLNRDESLARSLVLDQDEGVDAAAPDSVCQIVEIMQQTALDEASAMEAKLDQHLPSGLQESHAYVRNVCRAMHKRALFVTHSGFVGVGPKILQKGDLVVVPFGSSVPFVIRKTDRRSRYTLVVDCYVHGIMNGEVMKQVDAGEVSSEMFTLI